MFGSIWVKTSNKQQKQTSDPEIVIRMYKLGMFSKKLRYFTICDDKLKYYKDEQLDKQIGELIFSFNFKFQIIFKQQKLIGIQILQEFTKQTKLMFDYTENQQKIDEFIIILRLKLNQINIRNIYAFDNDNQLGEGSYAKVHMAQNKINKNYYALKEIYKFKDPKMIMAIQNEIQALRQFKGQQNILQIFECFEVLLNYSIIFENNQKAFDKNFYYIVTDILQKLTLRDMIKLYWPLTQICLLYKRYNQIGQIIKGILQGIQIVHNQGYMHRDLKPQNILFKKKILNDENIVIIDFGLSQKFKDETFLFNKCGTIGYVAPEILNYNENQQKYNEKCDIFSIGIILHQLLFKYSPFDAKNHQQRSFQNKMGDIDFNKKIYQNLPSIVLDYLKKLLQKNPLYRYDINQALNHEFIKNFQNINISFTDEPQIDEQFAQSFIIQNEGAVNLKNFPQIILKQQKYQ